MFDTDLVALGYNPQTYLGNIGQSYIETANGVVTRQRIMIEMQLKKPDWTPASDWFVERGVITPFGPTQIRLSGLELRSHLYFATAPGNQSLYVAQKKNGIVTQLPVV